MKGFEEEIKKFLFFLHIFRNTHYMSILLYYKFCEAVNVHLRLAHRTVFVCSLVAAAVSQGLHRV